MRCRTRYTTRGSWSTRRLVREGGGRDPFVKNIRSGMYLSAGLVLSRNAVALKPIHISRWTHGWTHGSRRRRWGLIIQTDIFSFNVIIRA